MHDEIAIWIHLGEYTVVYVFCGEAHVRMSRIASLKSGIGRNGSGHSGHSVKQPIM